MAEVKDEIISPKELEKLKSLEKPKKKPLSPVVEKKNIVSTKKTLGQKFAELFVPRDIREVASYISRDIIVPGIEGLILDGLESFFFDEPGGWRRGRRRRSSYRDSRDSYDYTPYDAYYKSESYGYRDRRRRDRGRDDRRDEPRYRENEKVDYRNIVLIRREDAEKVAKELRQRIEDCDQATVADLFELIGESSSYVDSNWGWVDPNDIGIRRVSSGWLIDVADVIYLE